MSVTGWHVWKHTDWAAKTSIVSGHMSCRAHCQHCMLWEIGTRPEGPAYLCSRQPSSAAPSGMTAAGAGRDPESKAVEDVSSPGPRRWPRQGIAAVGLAAGCWRRPTSGPKCLLWLRQAVLWHPRRPSTLGPVGAGCVSLVLWRRWRTKNVAQQRWLPAVVGAVCVRNAAVCRCGTRVQPVQQAC